MSWIAAIVLTLSSAAAIDCNELIPKKCDKNPKMQAEFMTSWEALESKAPSIFKEVRQNLLSFIENNVSNPEHRKAMLERVRRSEADFDWRMGGEGLFDHEKLIVHIGRDSLKVPSELSLVQLISHELVHAIDPCRMMEPVGEDPALPPILEFTELPKEVQSFFNQIPFTAVHNCLVQPDSAGHQTIRREIQSRPPPRRHCL